MAFIPPHRGIRLSDFINTKAPALRIASAELVTCQETDALERIIPVLTHRFRRIPVIGRKSGDFRGFVTTSDVLDYLGAGEKGWIFRKRRGSLKIPVKSIMEPRVFSLDKSHSVRKALEAFHEHRRGACPILYRGKLLGIIAEWDFVKQIDSPVGIRVEELMVRRPMIARDSFTLLDVAKIMVRGRFRRLPVARDNILMGIVTPSDILSYLSRNRMLGGLARDRTRVTSAMNKNVATIGPDLDVSRAAIIMAKKRIGGLPVVEDEELVGIITERDIVDALR